MNWAQFKDPVSHTCLAGTVVATWSLTQKMASSSPFTVMTNIFVTEFSDSVNSVKTFEKNSIGLKLKSGIATLRILNELRFRKWTFTANLRGIKFVRACETTRCLVRRALKM